MSKNIFDEVPLQGLWLVSCSETTLLNIALFDTSDWFEITTSTNLISFSQNDFVLKPHYQNVNFTATKKILFWQLLTCRYLPMQVAFFKST